MKTTLTSILLLTLAILILGCTAHQSQMPTFHLTGSLTNTTIQTPEALSAYQTERVATVIAVKTKQPKPIPTISGITPIIIPPKAILPSVLPILTLDATQKLATPSSTPFFLRTKFPKACTDEFYEDFTKISPDGSWLAESCSSNGTMQVSNRDGTKVFVVDNHDYFSDPYNPEMSGSVTPVHWSKDSHFIYYTISPEQWNDGAYLALDSLAPMLGRMDIVSGTSTILLSGTFYHSFSPTDRRLIEVQEFKHPVELVIHDLKTGSSQALIPNNDPQYSQAALVLWSPDGLKFVFVAAFGGEYGDDVISPNIQALILVELSDLSQRVIVSEITDFIEPISWDENDMIVYEIMDYENRYLITTFSYDFQKQEIIVFPSVTPLK